MVIKEKPFPAMTKESLRAFRGLDHLSDEEAQTVILTLRRFSALAFMAYQFQKQKCLPLKLAA